jgi:nitrite reductase/ring-hydroxylating ferredoxin subunit
MGAYFDFLKDNGSRLDPKTRALISVITKVAVQTEGGLVQYTRRALAAGASAEEILDALMMAFPALGLSRIVWAVDILIAHGFEGFADAAPDGDGGEPAAALDAGELAALPEQQVVRRDAGGRPLLLFREGETVRAYKAYCAHQGMLLMASGCKGRRVTCAQHGWTFELPDGRSPRGPRWSLEELAVTVTDGRVMVVWTE